MSNTTSQKSQQSSGQRRKILSEESYTSTLTSIITRDYYPSIPSLHRDISILQKRSEGNIHGAIAIRRASRQLERHEEELAAQEEKEESEAVEDGGVRKVARPLHRENVAGFHSRVTSEDNAEFEVEQEKAEKIRHEVLSELPLLTDGGKKSSASSKKRRLEGETPLLASDRFNATPTSRRLCLEQPATNAVQNSLFFTPTHDPSASGAESKEMKLIENGNNEKKEETTTKLLMPPPANRPSKSSSSSTKNAALVQKESSSQQQPQQQEVAKAQLVEYTPKTTSSSSSDSTTHTPTIIPQNTRFTYQNASKLPSFKQAPSSSSSSYPQPLQESDTTDLDATPPSLHQERLERLEAKQAECETFVNMTPLIKPDGGGEGENDSPIVTWGNVASTPLVLATQEQSLGMHGQLLSIMNEEEEKEGEKAYKLPNVNDREKVARLAETKMTQKSKRMKSASSSITTPSRKKSRGGGGSSSSSMMLNRAAKNLTPAAQSLLAKTSGKNNNSTRKNSKNCGSIISARSSNAFGSALRGSYTPQIQKTPSSSSSKKKRRSGGGKNEEAALICSTPRMVGSGGGKKKRIEKSGIGGGGNITDGLL